MCVHTKGIGNCIPKNTSEGLNRFITAHQDIEMQVGLRGRSDCVPSEEM